MESESSDNDASKGPIQNNTTVGKSCKGCLYYSSILKSKSRNPFCVGVSRTLPQVPNYIVGESELEASQEGRSLSEFKYGCVGYSVFLENKDHSNGSLETQAELPSCVGIEFLFDKRAKTIDSATTHGQHKKDDHPLPQLKSDKPANSMGDEFLGRFARNGSLVASGVAKNMNKVGNFIKNNFDDILYPFRRRPK